MEGQVAVHADSAAVAPAPSLLHSNLENLMIDSPARDASPENDELVHPASPPRGMLGGIFRKRKREVSSPRPRTPASEIFRRAFVAGNGSVQPTVPDPPVNATPIAIDTSLRDRREPMGYNFIRKVRRLIGWNVRSQEPTQVRFVDALADAETEPLSCSTLMDTPTIETPSLPCVPRNSPVRSDLTPLSPRSDQQRLLQTSLESRAAAAGAADAAVFPDPKPPGSRFAIGQRIKERVGAVNRFLTRESGRWFRIRTFPYIGHLEAERPPAEADPEGATTSGGYDGDNEGQDDTGSGFSRPAVSYGSAAVPAMGSQDQIGSQFQPAAEHGDEALQEGSTGFGGIINAPQVLSGDDGDDESSGKAVTKASK